MRSRAHCTDAAQKTTNHRVHGAFPLPEIHAPIRNAHKPSRTALSGCAGEDGAASPCREKLEDPFLPSWSHEKSNDGILPRARKIPVELANGFGHNSGMQSRIPTIAISAVLIVGVVYALWPQVGSGPASRRSQCKNNLKQIGLALHNYHESYGSFPPQYTVDADGKPLLSWRVLILPQADQTPLYRRFDLSKSWDSPENRRWASEVLPQFLCPSCFTEDTAKAVTNYVGVAGDTTVWRGSTALRKSDLLRDLSSVIMVVEIADSGIPWAKPEDLIDSVAAAGTNSSSTLSPSSRHGESPRGTPGTNVLFADGHIEYLKAGIDDKRLRKCLGVPE